MKPESRGGGWRDQYGAMAPTGTLAAWYIDDRLPAPDKKPLHAAIKKQLMHFSPFSSAAVDGDKGSGPFSITLWKGAGEKVASKRYSSFKWRFYPQLPQHYTIKEEEDAL